MSSSQPAPGPSGAPGMPPIPADWATEDRGQQIIVIFWVEVAIASMFLTARLTSRMMIRSLSLDDALMFVSLLCFVTLSGLITNIATLGGFRHVPFVPMQNLSTILLRSLVAQAVTVLAYGLSKFSIGYLILRLLPPDARWQRVFLWVVVSLTMFYNCLQIILTFVQCDPYEGAWNPLIPSVCWTTAQRQADIYTGGVYNIIVDVILALFPITLLWKLQLSLKKKISMMVLLGLGLLAALCACIKLKYVDSLFGMDATWATYDLDVWSGSELFVVIVCGSVPPCKALWDRLFPHAKFSTDRSAGARYGSLPSKKSTGPSGYQPEQYENVQMHSAGCPQYRPTIMARTDITVEERGMHGHAHERTQEYY